MRPCPEASVLNGLGLVEMSLSLVETWVLGNFGSWIIQLRMSTASTPIAGHVLLAILVYVTSCAKDHCTRGWVIRLF